MASIRESTIQALAAYLPIFKGVAIAGSLWNAGSMTTAYRLLPSIYPLVQRSPRESAKQWEFYYWALSATVPITDLVTILACSGLAYIGHRENKDAFPWKVWAAAAGIMPLGWAWVWTLMLKPSNKLLAIANPSGVKVEQKNSPADPQKTMDLLTEFNSLMMVRMTFPWVVGGLALWASSL